jgi:hypothetical protein
MKVLYVIALTLLLATVVLIIATEKLRKEIRNAEEDNASG